MTPPHAPRRLVIATRESALAMWQARIDSKVVGGPEIFARGFALDDGVFDEIRPKVLSALEDAVAGGVTDTHQLQQVIRRTVGSWVGRRIRRRPMILPTVIEA